ncbi:LOW QUALITY PROTEIN: proline and serine-rich protein 3 [Ctenodactylus gundi]
MHLRPAGSSEDDADENFSSKFLENSFLSLSRSQSSRLPQASKAAANSTSRTASPPSTTEGQMEASQPPAVMDCGNSVVAKYINRFRQAQPTSREERQSTGPITTDFWWLRPGSSDPSTQLAAGTNELFRRPNPTVSNPAKVPITSQSTVPLQKIKQNLNSWRSSLLDLETLSLQSRASRLLRRSKTSISSSSLSPSDASSSSFPASSDSLSPFSMTTPDSSKDFDPKVPAAPRPAQAPGPAAAPASSPAPLRPEDDILYQWRQRRKLEQARGGEGDGTWVLPKTPALTTQISAAPAGTTGFLGTQPNSDPLWGSVAQPGLPEVLNVNRPPVPPGASPHPFWACSPQGFFWAPQPSPWVSLTTGPTPLPASALTPLAPSASTPVPLAFTPAPLTSTQGPVTFTLDPLASTPAPSTSVLAPQATAQVPLIPTSAPLAPPSTPAATPQGLPVTKPSSSEQAEKVGSKTHRARISHREIAGQVTADSKGPGPQLRGALGQVVIARLFPDSLEDTPSCCEDSPLPESLEVRAIPTKTKVTPPPSETQCQTKARSGEAKATPSPAGPVLWKGQATVSAEAEYLQTRILPSEEMSIPPMAPPSAFEGVSLEPLEVPSPTTDPTPSEDLFSQAVQLLEAAEDSDGSEFQDDPVLQVLRAQRAELRLQKRTVDAQLFHLMDHTESPGSWSPLAMSPPKTLRRQLRREGVSPDARRL